MLRNTFFICVALCTLSCSKKPDRLKTTELYFNISGFIDNEIKILKGKQLLLRKTASFNDELSEFSAKQINWEKEFKVFSLIDLNKKSNSGKFTADTIEMANGYQKVLYTSVNDATFTKSAEILINPFGKVEMITVENESGISFLRNKMVLNYISQKGFNLIQNRKNFAGNDITLIVHGDISDIY